MGLEEGATRADEAPAGLDAAQGSPIPAETQGVPPPEFTATGEPDLSEAGLAKAAKKAKLGTTVAPSKTTPPASRAAPAAPADPAAKPAEETPDDEASDVEAPEVEPTPKEEEPADRLTSQLRSREKKLVSQQTAFARERAEFDTYKRSTESQIAQHRGQLAQAEKVLDLVRQDPMQLLRDLGWTEELIGQRLVNGNRPSPREVEAQVLRELADTRAELAAERQERERVFEEARAEQELSSFVSASRSDPGRWPIASRYSEAKLRSQGLALVHQYAAQGIELSNEEILDKIEDEFSEITSHAAKGKNGKASSTRAARATPTRPQVAPTLTSEAAGERSVDLDGTDMLALELKDPDAFAAMSRAEIDNEVRRRSPR